MKNINRNNHFTLEALEPRLLFSADLAGVHFESDQIFDQGEGISSVVESTVPFDNLIEAQIENIQDQRHELVFIDPGIADFQKLADSISANQEAGRTLEIIFLDGTRDGVEQLSEIIAKYQKIDAVHIFSHGMDGAVQLGNTWLNQERIDGYADSFESWRDVLTPDADLLFYGCDVAAGPTGYSFLNTLSMLTGADVAASSDSTGPEKLGADLDLEYSVGAIESLTVLNSKNINSWHTTLGATDPLWLTTDKHVATGGQTGLATWNKGDLVQITDPDLSFGDGTTDGTFSSVFSLADFTGNSGDNLNALHYVSSNIKIGTTNTLELKIGDLLFSTAGNISLINGSEGPYDPGFSDTLSSVTKNDVVVFRPDTLGDYSEGTFAFLLQDLDGADIRGISLIEKNTDVGGTTLQAGDFLFLRDGGAEESSIWLYETDDVGVSADGDTNYTDGSVTELLIGSDPGININKKIYGIDLVETTLTLGAADTVVNAGTILISLDADDTVGDNDLDVTKYDIIALNVTDVSDENDENTGDATASLFFTGDDVSFDSASEIMDGFSLTSSQTTTAPTGGYTVDNVIPAAQISQATDGSGIITINWKAWDPDADDVTLNNFQYSDDGGTTWYTPSQETDGSGPLSEDWDDNPAAGDWSSATDFASATAHFFTFDTQHDNVSATQSLAGVDQSDIQIRFYVSDEIYDSILPATSESFRVDNATPVISYTNATFDQANEKIVLNGTNFNDIAANTTDLINFTDWDQFIWDINADGGITANIAFDASEIVSVIINNDSQIEIFLTTAKTNAIAATADFGAPGGADSVSISQGFISDLFGNEAISTSNNLPTATNINAAETYIEDTILNFVNDIVVGDADGGTLSVYMGLSDSAAGSLSTGTSNAVTSTYDAGTGVWSANGAIADLNILLANLTFTPAANYDSNITINVTVSDGVGSPTTGQLTVTATPVGDTPTATSITTLEDTQSGLIILNRNANDGAEVTHFKITSISGGILYQADGVTVINNNDFITYAQGFAGLKFTPSSNSSAAGSFKVQSSEDGGTVAAQSATAATSTITVTPVGDTPTVTNITTNEETLTGAIVISRAATDGAEVTHFKITNITGGTLYKDAAKTQLISNGNYITVAEGATVYFLPTANLWSGDVAGSTFTFDVQSSEDGATVAAQSAASATSTITVDPLGDTPSVTNITTNEETVSGAIVISRAATDGAEVTHFKITNITGGTLYKDAAKTQLINNGNYITVAEGATVYFLPTANLWSGDIAGSTFIFDVQSSEDGATVAAQSTASATSTITVNPVGDTPSVTSITTNEETVSGAIVISRAATDGAEVTHFKITNITGGTLYKDAAKTQLINNGNYITVAEGATVYFLPTANLWSGDVPGSTFAFDVQSSEDGATVAGQSGTATSTITVDPVGDTPTVTDKTTNEDTLSGLIILDRNASDGAEVTHFKVSSISGGNLYQADGTTIVNSNDFITYAQGLAGLKFTPSSNSNAAGSFKVESSENGTSVAGQSGKVTSTITVTPVADTPTITDISTNEETQSGLIILDHNVSDGAEVTHFKISNITGGSVFHSDGTTEIVNGEYITYAEGQNGLKFTPSTPTPASQEGSFDVEASEDGTNVSAQSGTATSTITITTVTVVTVPPSPPPAVDPGPAEPEVEEQQEAEETSEEGGETDVVIVTNLEDKSKGSNENSLSQNSVLFLSPTILANGFENSFNKAEQATARTSLINFGSEYSSLGISFQSLEQIVQQSIDEIPQLVEVFSRMKDNLNEMRNEVSNSITYNKNVVASSIVMSTGMSVGYVLWLLRGGALLTSVLSSLPAWQLADPLPILSSAAKGSDDDDESLADIIKKGSEKHSKNEDKKHEINS